MARPKKGTAKARRRERRQDDRLDREAWLLTRCDSCGREATLEKGGEGKDPERIDYYMAPCPRCGCETGTYVNQPEAA